MTSVQQDAARGAGGTPFGLMGGWLLEGWRAFKACPLASMVFSALFVAISLLMMFWLTTTDRWLIYAVFAAGFVLVSPFLWVGYYRIGDRRLSEKPPPLFGVYRELLKSPGAGWAIAMVTGAIFLVWVTDALIIYSVYFSFGPTPELFSDPQMRASATEFLFFAFLLWLVLSAITFPITVLSLPHAVLSGEGFVDAIVFSVKRVFGNLPLFLLWGAGTGLAMLLVTTLFPPLGLLVYPLIAYANRACYRAMVH